MEAGRRRVLLISNDVVGKAMAGPGIRCWELAQVLARDFDVTLAHPRSQLGMSHPKFRMCPVADDAPLLRQLVDEADVILLDPWSLDRIGTVAVDKYVVADIYDPFLLENLELFREQPLAERTNGNRNDRRLTEGVLTRADFLICAGERQADYWLGALT